MEQTKEQSEYGYFMQGNTTAHTVKISMMEQAYLFERCVVNYGPHNV